MIHFLIPASAFDSTFCLLDHKPRCALSLPLRRSNRPVLSQVCLTGISAFLTILLHLYKLSALRLMVPTAKHVSFSVTRVANLRSPSG
jgi:hypothetical protein